MTDEVRLKAAALPIWKGKVEPVPLSGGITNVNSKVVDGDDTYVVRIGGNIPEQSRGSDPERNLWMSRYLDAEMLARVDALRPIADDLGISLAQLALAWCLRKPNIRGRNARNLQRYRCWYWHCGWLSPRR